MSWGPTLTAEHAWRDYVTPGDAGSGRHDPVKADIRGMLGRVQFGDLPTRADYAGLDVPAAVLTIETSGHTDPGDLGAARYKRTGSEPAHEGKVQSADGAWWVLVPQGGGVRAPQVGCFVGAATTEMATAVTAAAAYVGKTLIVPAGTYTFTGEVDWSALDRVIRDGDVVFDFSAADTIGNFPNGGFVYVGGGGLTALPDLASDVAAGDNELTFVSDPSLSPGDRPVIYDPNNGSYNAARTYYRAGENVEVSAASGVNVEIMGGLYAGYTAATVDVYLHPAKKFTLEGGTLTIIESEDTNLNGIAGFYAEHLDGPDLSRVLPTNSTYSGICFDQCINLAGVGYRVLQHRFTTTNYGVTVANCQDGEIEGTFSAGRHGVSMGGFDKPGAVPCRNITVRGTCRNSEDALHDIGAFDTHGNCEHISFYGRAYGSVSVGGNYHRIDALIKTHASQSGEAVAFREMSGTSFDFSGSRIIAHGNPQTVGRGVIDIGGNDTSTLNANTTLGGVLNFDGMVIDAPAAQIMALIRNRGYVGSDPIIISFRGVRWPTTSAGSPVALQIQAGETGGLSGDPFSQLWLHGFDNSAGGTYNLTGVTSIKGWRKTGTVTLTPSTSADEVTTAVSSLGAPAPPRVQLTMAAATLGGSSDFGLSVASPAKTGFGVKAKNASGNFGSTTAGDVYWTAEVDQ